MMRTALAAITRCLHLNFGAPQFEMCDSLEDPDGSTVGRRLCRLVEGSLADRVTRNFMRIKYRKGCEWAERKYLGLGVRRISRWMFDEWASYDIVSENELNMLARAPKHGISTTVISQGLDTGDPHLNRRFAQLVHRKECFRSSGYEEAYEQAKFYHDACNRPKCCSLLRERKRNVTDYVTNTYVTETESNGKSGDNDVNSRAISTQTRRDPIQRTEVDYVPRYLGNLDHHLLATSVIMRMKPGERIVGHFVDVFMERVPRLEDEPWD